ncbi:bifunctional folylpolyglutamate synthase/dihydrofolate synthase [Seleniivibrio woodruffii]|uniref:Dihydrofolate synthase/folylpolyglutamate synthase n=1 Tax=Seleniivibrio woodruffii TaxID=1078050 RepID=A0A4R1K2V6_9BACT|nr:Mur ligase family protein [Seleniivibrio woodruffii]TCK58352.1 dihydrofolate synthase/folylpolyglutamate synthase [Seleniivibrio woodruffii]TVZ36726.1 dihydrofolate synthase/folylpolyglutamate synthase [Seleniivibrio woodruffii]
MPYSLFEVFFKNRGEFKNLELTLKRIKTAAESYGIGDNIAKNIIHIAGTNGKGSTSYFIDQILRHRGLSTGLFTSPHISSVTERIKLNGADISGEEFDRIFSIIEPSILINSLSYFETLTLIAFYYYMENQPDAVIIETGLGGRFDSTNILDRKIPVITSISMDHMEYLGNDIISIANEKLAIIKNNPLFFLGANTKEVSDHARKEFADRRIIQSDYSETAHRGFQPPYADNLRLAEAVCDHIIKGSVPDTLKLPPCRMERFGRFVLDGAHNEDGLNRLMANYKDKKPIVIFSCTRDRDAQKHINIIKQAASEVILTQIPNNERSIDVNDLITDAHKRADVWDAVKLAVELKQNTDILVCGSLYLCAAVREILVKGSL